MGCLVREASVSASPEKNLPVSCLEDESLASFWEPSERNGMEIWDRSKAWNQHVYVHFLPCFQYGTPTLNSSYFCMTTELVLSSPEEKTSTCLVSHVEWRRGLGVLSWCSDFQSTPLTAASPPCLYTHTHTHTHTHTLPFTSTLYVQPMSF